jgi:hypothetical protein
VRLVGRLKSSRTSRKLTGGSLICMLGFGTEMPESQLLELSLKSKEHSSLKSLAIKPKLLTHFPKLAYQPLQSYS